MNINETSARRLRRAAINSLSSRREKEEEFNYSNCCDCSDPEKLMNDVINAFNRTEHAMQIIQNVPDDKHLRARDVIPEGGDFINE